jgi:hypothetical protein
MTEPGALVLLAIVLAAAIAAGVICWIVSDNGRVHRLAMIIGSLRRANCDSASRTRQAA